MGEPAEPASGEWRGKLPSCRRNPFCLPMQTQNFIAATRNFFALANHRQNQRHTTLIAPCEAMLEAMRCEAKSAAALSRHDLQGEILRTAMASQEQHREQITIPVPAELRQAIERAAAAEDRTMAGFIRNRLRRALEQQSEAAA
jgi:hypothetical protein